MEILELVRYPVTAGIIVVAIFYFVVDRRTNVRYSCIIEHLFCEGLHICQN